MEKIDIKIKGFEELIYVVVRELSVLYGRE